jgi:hypothetical protein
MNTSGKVWSSTFEQIVDDVESPEIDKFNRVLIELDSGVVVDIPYSYLHPIPYSYLHPIPSKSCLPAGQTV